MEMCDSGDTIESDPRPAESALVWIMAIYLGNAAVLPLTLLFVQFVNAISPFKSQLPQNFFWVLLVLLHAFTWSLPVLLISAYMIASDGQLEKLSLFFVRDAIPDASFLIHLASWLYFWLAFFFGGFEWPYMWLALVYTGFAGGLEYLGWLMGVDAVRRIDPLFQSKSDLLLPSFFHYFMSDADSNEVTGETDLMDEDQQTETTEDVVEEAAREDLTFRKQVVTL